MAVEAFVDFVCVRLPQLWLRTGEHLILTGVSTGAAILLGIPLGVLASRVARLRGFLLGAIGILQTIPSLAMLAILLALTGKIGAVPAVIALALYALLPIVRNTLTGIQGVSSAALEAARGLGMTNHQQLWQVKIPLALPFIVAGIRTAAVTGVGIATLSAFIGAGGLGQFINRGLALASNSLILLGAIPAALLALVVDFSIGAVGWGLQPRRHRHLPQRLRILFRTLAFLLPFIIGVAGAIAYMSGAAVTPVSRPGSTIGDQGRGAKVVVGSKNFTEQLILGELMAQLIEARTRLARGEIDIYPEYTGTALTAILKREALLDPDETFKVVARAYRRQFGIEWLQSFGFNNTYAITVRKKDAHLYGWERISDLTESAASLRAGFTSEFAERPDGYLGLRKVYGFRFREVRDFDPTLMYEALAKGEVDVICAFATDGRITAYKLKPLSDDRGFFPPYYAAPVVREEVLKAHPEIRDALTPLLGLLDDLTMQGLNYEVDGKKYSPRHVARDFLKSHNLLHGD
jgi:osmoprotectant transport system permease protein